MGVMSLKRWRLDVTCPPPPVRGSAASARGSAPYEAHESGISDLECHWLSSEALAGSSVVISMLTPCVQLP